MLSILFALALCTPFSYLPFIDMTDQNDKITYLALGDSYTIGEAVDESDRWPVQLVSKANKDGFKVDDPKIIATTGWTTDELKQGISDANMNGTSYDIVSLLIGVNNQYRGQDMDIYKKGFDDLLMLAIGFAGGKKENVFVVSIPDYGVTPFGKDKKEQIAKELDAYNQYAEDKCKELGVKYVYITDISRQAENDPSLIASDNLHPSGEMYRRWVPRIYPWFKEKLISQ